MKHTRRGFFGLLAAALAASADPERLLWVPGRKLISIPKPVIVSTLPLPLLDPAVFVWAALCGLKH